MKFIKLAFIVFFCFFVKDTFAFARPTFTSDPVHNATNVHLDKVITLTFDQAIRKIDDSEITNSNIASLIVLRKLNKSFQFVSNAGFSATISDDKKIITITPNPVLESGFYYFIQITGVENNNNEAIHTNDNSFYFLTVTTTAPTVTPSFSDANNAPIDDPLVLTFDQAIRNIDNSEIKNDNVKNLLIFKLTDVNGGEITDYTATINAEKTMISISLGSAWPKNTTYYLEVDGFENNVGAPGAKYTYTFTTTNTSTPVATFIPSNGATGVPIRPTITLTFDQKIRNIDNTAISDANIKSLLSFIKTENTTSFTAYNATVTHDDAANTTTIAITLQANQQLEMETNYTVSIQAVENFYGVASSTQSISFTTARASTVAYSSTNICKGNSTTLAPFTINEEVKANFPVTGGLVGIRLRLPAGYVFDHTQPGAITLSSNTDITNTEIEFQLNGILYTDVVIRYHVTSTDYVDEITVSGLKVIAIINATAGDMTRDGGAAFVPGVPNGTIFGSIQPTDPPAVTLSTDDANDKVCPGGVINLTATVSPSGAGTYTFYSTDGTTSQLLQATSTNNKLVLEDSKLVNGSLDVYVVYNEGTDCAGTSATKSINRYEITTPAQFVNPSDEAVSISANQTIAISVSPTGGTLRIEEENSETTLSGGTYTFDANTVNVGDAPVKRTLVYSYAHSNGCVSTDTLTINILPLAKLEDLSAELQARYCTDNLEDRDISLNWNPSSKPETNTEKYSLISITGYGVGGTKATGFTRGNNTGYNFNPQRAYNELGKDGEVTIKVTYKVDHYRWVNNCYPVFNPDGSTTTECNSEYVISHTETLSDDFVISFRPAPSPELMTVTREPLKSVYCANSTPVYLFGRPGNTFEGKEFFLKDLDKNVTIPLYDYSFKPGLGADEYPPNESGYQIVLKYTDPLTGCSSYDTADFKIVNIPGIAVAQPDTFRYCIGDAIQPISYPQNDADYALIWRNSSGVPLDTITFVDGDIAFTPPVETFRSSSNTFYVSQLHKWGGCEGPRQTIIVNVGSYPTADFKTYDVCIGTGIVFEDLSANGSNSDVFQFNEILEWNWDFGNGETSTLQNPVYTYQEPGTYAVRLTVTTWNGCSHTTEKRVNVFKEIRIVDGSTGYLETFETNNHGWVQSGVTNAGSVSSWQLVTPTGNKINKAASGAYAWITSGGVDKNGNLTNTYNNRESSWVESPCIDFSAVARPMLSLKIWTDCEEDFDGAVVQYTYGSSGWKVLGSINEGINWYNKENILSSPGNQKPEERNRGWTGASDTTWRTARFVLDEVQQEVGNELVRFRVAFASNDVNRPGSQFDGFAFDDFMIKSREKVVVLEHFTNLKSSGVAEEDERLEEFVQPELAKGQAIHLRYFLDKSSTPDSLSESNWHDPSARSFYYSLSEQPRTVMDGKYHGYYKNEPFFLNNWGPELYKTRVLEDPIFDVDLDVSVDQGLVVKAALSKRPTPYALDGWTDVQIAIVEKELHYAGKVYTHVVKKLLPNAGGTTILTGWQPDDTRTETVTVKWAPRYSLEGKNLMLVVYVQNNHPLRSGWTKEIYQAAYMDLDPAILAQVPIVTGIADELNNENLQLYPNPANKSAIIKLARPLSKACKLDVYDSQGRKVQSVQIAAGTKELTLATESFTNGLYIIRIQNGVDTVSRKLYIQH